MDKHGLALLLMGKPKEDGGMPEGGPPPLPEDVKGESVSSLKAHMKNSAHELLKAIREDDADKLCEAFCTMHSLDHALMDKEEMGEKEDEPEEEGEEETEEEEPEEAAE
ncbi:MAG TPA: hypothetical protein VJ305_19825 [Streptosporangiaceae bacterium]|nr:hypothetical protein [Streptosporangiaceae bacterium]